MAGLAAIYSSTELYMLTDDSLDHWDSWNFLERQIEGTIGADESILDVAMTIGSGAMSMATAMASLGMQVYLEKRYPLAHQARRRRRRAHMRRRTWT